MPDGSASFFDQAREIVAPAPNPTQLVSQLVISTPVGERVATLDLLIAQACRARSIFTGDAATAAALRETADMIADRAAA